jgi:MFS family permease
MMLARFLLGVAESSISPGFSLITGIWYNRGEQPLRHGLWFAGNSLATMFGGLLAYAVAHINGSIAAWKVCGNDKQSFQTYTLAKSSLFL